MEGLEYELQQYRRIVENEESLGQETEVINSLDATDNARASEGAGTALVTGDIRIPFIESVASSEALEGDDSHSGLRVPAAQPTTPTTDKERANRASRSRASKSSESTNAFPLAANNHLGHETNTSSSLPRYNRIKRNSGKSSNWPQEPFPGWEVQPEASACYPKGEWEARGKPDGAEMQWRTASKPLWPPGRRRDLRLSAKDEWQQQS